MAQGLSYPNQRISENDMGGSKLAKKRGAGFLSLNPSTGKQIRFRIGVGRATIEIHPGSPYVFFHIVRR